MSGREFNMTREGTSKHQRTTSFGTVTFMYKYLSSYHQHHISYA